MDLDERLKALSGAAAKNHLIRLITSYCVPAFGALPKREIDHLMFELLGDVGALPKEASIFDLMQELRITRSKAQSLLYDQQIRSAKRDSEDLDRQIRDLLGNAKFSRDGNYFVIEIEDPLLQAFTRERVRKLGHVSDASFNSSLIRLSLDAVTDLATALLSDEENEAVRQALVNAGAPDTSIRGVLKAALGMLAKKVAGKAGEELGKEIGGELNEFLGPVFQSATKKIAKLWPAIFASDDDVQQS